MTYKRKFFGHIVTRLVLFSFLYLSACVAGPQENVREEPVLETPPPAATHQAYDSTSVSLPPGPLSLKHAIAMALKHNPDYAITLARIQQARAALKAADASFYPQAGFYSEYSQGDAPSGYLFKKIDQRKLPPVDFNNPGSFENYETGIRMGLNLYNGGRDRLTQKQLEVDLNIRRLDRKEAENRLLTSVIHTYYDCLATQDFIGIAQESVATVQDQLRVMQVRFDAGGALKSDVLSLKVRLAQAQENLLRSQNDAQTARAHLASILGISPDRRIEPSGSGQFSFSMPQDYTQMVSKALQTRAELKKAQQQIHQARIGLTMAQSGYLPQLDLKTQYYYSDPDLGYNADRKNWMGSLVFNWPFFTGFSTRYRIKAASARFEQAHSAYRKTLLAVRLDVKKANLKMAETRARLEVARNSVASAQESLKLVKLQYAGGSATITRYLEAEFARNKARINATAAFYDQEKARADLARAMGLLQGHR